MTPFDLLAFIALGIAITLATLIVPVMLAVFLKWAYRESRLKNLTDWLGERMVS